MTLPDPPTPAGLFDLSGRTAIVTGASSGLGWRFARVLADAGATVFAAARRADRLTELSATHPSIRPVACDVARIDDLGALVEQASAASGRVDVLVNNAGLAGAPRVEDESPQLLGQVLDVNLVAVFELCRRVAALAGDRGAAIVNVTSVLGMVAGYPIGGASYAASKGAVISLTRELAAQWGRRGIRVNALAPGWFRTEMTEQLFADERASAFVHSNAMLGRAGAVGELDGALLFLASTASSYVTGQVLVVDGGWTAR
jgi:NAD(P)-dependent dehydrogenase (short-subunit alcohol dehydrogenase family)